jgi:cell division protein FtsQ
MRSRLAPSPRSILVGLALVALGVGAYVVARNTSAFAVRRIEVDGATPALAAQVQHALQPLLGTSLVGIDGSMIERRVDALPEVVSTSYDRAFPHTLRVHVAAERTVAVLRTGTRAWLVSARGRLISPVGLSDQPLLPRIWEPARMQPAAGDFLAGDAGGVAARAVGLASRFPVRIRAASYTGGQLVFQLRSGLALRLGEPFDLRLKLTVARRALAVLPAGSTYLDVSLPGRPVVGQTNPQVSSRG